MTTASATATTTATTASAIDHSRAILDAMASRIAVVDTEGRIVQTNLAWDRFAHDSGVPAQFSWIGQDYLAACSTTHSTDDPTPGLAVAGIRSVLHGQREEYTLDYPCHSPRARYWFQMRARRLPAPHGPALCVVSHEDITARMLAEQRLVEQRETDALTQLANRRHFENRWALAWERARQAGLPLALLALELPGYSGDGEAGVPQLKALADMLRALAIEVDGCAARFSDVRLLLLTTPDHAPSLAARLQAWREHGAGASEPWPWRLHTVLLQPAEGQDPRRTLAWVVSLAEPPA